MKLLLLSTLLLISIESFSQVKYSIGDSLLSNTDTEVVITDIITKKSGKKSYRLEYINANYTLRVSGKKLSSYQQYSSKIPRRAIKKDNLITIKTNKDNVDNMTRISHLLISKGFTFKTRDKESLYLITNPKTVSGQLKYTLNISFIDQNIFIRVQHTTISMSSVMIHNFDTYMADWFFTNDKGSTFQAKVYNSFMPVLNSFSDKLFFSHEQ